MNRPDLYFKTSQILLEAYRNETLFHSNWECCACANIIAANMGYTLRTYFYKKGCAAAFWKYNSGYVDSRSWGRLLWSTDIFDRMYLRLKFGRQKYDLVKRQLSSTGYSRSELLMMARQFDRKRDPADETENVLDSLKQVLFTLKRIHKVDHFDVQATYREVFLAEMRQVQSLPDTYDSVQRYYEIERWIQVEVFGINDNGTDYNKVSLDRSSAEEEIRDEEPVVQKELLNRRKLVIATV